MKGLNGNIGIWSDRHDAHFHDCIVVDYTIGMQIWGSANRITRCHLWSGTVPPMDTSVEEWSSIYGERKMKLKSGVYGPDEEQEYQNAVPEMLIGSVSFDMRGACNVLDGCYADTAETGYLIYNDARLVNCDFFNNKLMELKQSTAIKHVKGHLVVMSCAFRGTVGTEKLYEGIGEQVDWIANKSTGGEGMREPDFR